MVADNEIEINGNEIGRGALNEIYEKDKDKIMYLIKQIKDKAGDTITITKNKIKFSGENIEQEFEYSFSNSYINFIRSEFPFCSVKTETFKSENQTLIYQLRTGTYINITTGTYTGFKREKYLIDFYFYYFKI
ncbi:MAG: hypothetical protein FWG51_01260 [Firmicutes bacterium]|nr:hypothetical protein [Bacillota bacterium]